MNRRQEIRAWSLQAAVPAVLLAALFGAGCASGGQSGRVDIDPDAPADTLGAREGSQAVRVEVSNDVTPPTSIVVYVELGGGARYRLGRVQPGHTDTFEYSPQTETRRIRLLAETNRGEIIRSDPFAVTRAERIRWSVF